MNSGFPAILTAQLAEPCLALLDNLLAPLICIISGFLQQQFGPLRILMVSCVPYTAGWIAAAMATHAHHIYIIYIKVHNFVSIYFFISEYL
jgi:hypothetical protein